MPRVLIMLLAGFFLVLPLPILALQQTSAAKHSNSTDGPRDRSLRLTVEQAIQIALGRNPLVALALFKLRQVEQQAMRSYSDFFPVIGLAYGATWPKYRRSAGDLGPPDQVSRYDQIKGRSRLNLPLMDYPYRIDPYRRFTGTLTVTQPLYAGGKTVSAYESAKLEIRSQELQLSIIRQDLTRDVCTACYNMMQDDLLIDATQTYVEYLREKEEKECGKVVREPNNANESLDKKAQKAANKADCASIMMQRTNQEVNLRQYKTNREDDRAKLNKLLNNAPGTYAIIVHDYRYKPNSYSMPQILAVALNNRDEIPQANISILKDTQSIRQAKAGLLPAIQLQAQGSRTNDDWNVVDPEGIMGWTIIGNLTWTFDMFGKNAAVKEATEIQRQDLAKRDERVQQIIQDVKTAYFDMKRCESDIRDWKRLLEDIKKQGKKTASTRLSITENGNSDAIGAKYEPLDYYGQFIETYKKTYKEPAKLGIAGVEADTLTKRGVESAMIQNQITFDDTYFNAHLSLFKALIGYRINQVILERNMGILRR
jgi:outer membrane protein TolC